MSGPTWSLSTRPMFPYPAGTCGSGSRRGKTKPGRERKALHGGEPQMRNTQCFSQVRNRVVFGRAAQPSHYCGSAETRAK